jgi:hypothetical protein
LQNAYASGILDFLNLKSFDFENEPSSSYPTSLLYQNKPKLSLSFHTEDTLQVQQNGRDIWRIFNQSQEQNFILPLKEKFVIGAGKAQIHSNFTGWFNKSGSLSTLDFSANEEKLALAGKLSQKLWAGYTHIKYRGSGDGTADFSPSFTAIFGAPQDASLEEKSDSDIYELNYVFSPKLALRAQEKSYKLDTWLNLSKFSNSAYIPFKNNGNSWDMALQYRFNPKWEASLHQAQGSGEGEDIFAYNFNPIGDTRTISKFTGSSLALSRFNRLKNSRSTFAFSKYEGKANLEVNANLASITGNPGHFGHFLLENDINSTAYHLKTYKEYNSNWNLSWDLQHQALEYLSRLKTANTYYWGAIPWVYTDQVLFNTKGQIEMLGLTLGYKKQHFDVKYNFTQFLPHNFKDLSPAPLGGGGGGGGGSPISLSSPSSITRGGNMQSLTFSWEF